MADRQKTSQVVGQVEYTQSDPNQKTSQVVGQVEYTQSDSKQLTSFILGQVEFAPASGLFTYDSGGAGSLPGGLDPDYSSIATWEADTDTDLQMFEDGTILDCYDSQTHSLIGTITFSGATLTYWGSHRTLRSSPNCAVPFAGKAGTGSNFYFGSSVNDYFYVNEDYFIFEYCCITSDPANSSSDKYGLYVLDNETAIVCGIVAYDITNSGSGIGDGFRGHSYIVLNHCIAYGCKTYGFQVTSATALRPAIIHCTSCDNGSNGIFGDTSSILWGNYCGGNSTDFNEDADSASGWNASSDATADLGGDAGDNYKNNYDLLDGDFDADYLPTSAIGLSATGGAGDNFGRNPYNDLSASYDYRDYLKNDSSGVAESRKDIRGNDRPSGEVADTSWAIGAAEYQEGEEPPISGEIAMPNVILF